MWFWLVATPLALSSLGAPPQLTSGTSILVPVTLTDKAPAAGFLVNINITSTPPNLVAIVPLSPTGPIPNSITIQPGSSSGSFTIQAAANLAGQATITASAGGVTLAATLTVAPAVLTGQLVISPSTINFGDSASGFVTLSSPAPPGGAQITFSSDNPSIASVPSPPNNVVTVPAGGTTGKITITAGTIEGPTIITAKYAGGALSATITTARPIKPGPVGP